MICEREESEHEHEEEIEEECKERDHRESGKVAQESQRKGNAIGEKEKRRSARLQWIESSPENTSE